MPRGSRLLLPLAARSATTFSDPQYTDAGIAGVAITFNFTVQAAAETLIPIIQVRNVDDDSWLDYTSTIAAFSAIGQYFFLCYPSVMTGASTLGRFRNIAIPTNWRLRVNHSGTGEHTYSASLQTLE